MSIRDELDRLAATAPVADVPADTWSRARRARVREVSLRATAAVAVVVLVGVVAGLVGWAPLPDAPQPADGDDSSLGVPSMVWNVPSNPGLEVETDLAIGPGAVAEISENQEPVVVGADGDHHLLDLPGYHGEFFAGLALSPAGLSLSPDGLSLAWGWIDGDYDDDTDARAGVRVADLLSGEVRTIDLDPEVVVGSFGWSPDSRWLTWSSLGHRAGSRIDYGKQVFGRIAAGSTTSVALPYRASRSDLYAVDDDGVVVVASQGHSITWDGSQTGRAVRPGTQYAAVATPRDGILLEVVEGESGFRYRRLVGDTVTETRIPGLAHGTLTPYGWLDETTLVAARYDDRDASNHLVLVDLSDPSATSVRVVGDLDVTPAAIAVDLMSRERPTVDRPRPDWLDDHRLRTVLLVVVIAAALLGAPYLLQRRRRRPPTTRTIST